MRCVLLLLAVLCVAPGPPKPKPAKPDPSAAALKELQGEWVITRQEFDGVVVPVTREPSVTFSDGRMHLADGDYRPEGKVTLDAGKSPATIDVQWLSGPQKGKLGVGIYRLEKGVLTICLRAEADGARPADFSGAGKCVHVVTMRRKKAS